MARPFRDARKRRARGGSNAFNPLKHPRGPSGRFIAAGERLQAAVEQAGKNTVQHVEFGTVRRPAELSKMVGQDVRGFKHAASNQAMQHALAEHGNAGREKSRGQKQVTAADFSKLPQIVRVGTYHEAKQRPFGPRRVEIQAQIDGDRYSYMGEVRTGKRRIDMITMWKR